MDQPQPPPRERIRAHVPWCRLRPRYSSDPTHAQATRKAQFYVAKGNGSNISISLETGESYNYVHFSDDGTGMSPNALTKVFDRFYTSNEDGGGTGMGLSFCKLVMESFGGGIICRSRLGEFTEFTLRFPKGH